MSRLTSRGDVGVNLNAEDNSNLKKEKETRENSFHEHRGMSILLLVRKLLQKIETRFFLRNAKGYVANLNALPFKFLNTMNFGK